MSRFNVSVLLATGLLGVLLWVVLAIVRDVVRAPDEPLPMPADTVEIALDPTLPRINNYRDLAAWLGNQQLPAAALMNGYRDWLSARGYPAIKQPLLPPVDTRDDISYSEQDDATLISLAGTGNIEALHELATRSLETDPLAALEWYDQAIVNGSLYAMERVADLLVTLSDPILDSFVSDPLWQESLQQFQALQPRPRENALAWSIAAITAGGYGIVTPEHTTRIRTLGSELDAAGIDRACETAQRFVLEAAASRRARGEAVFSMQGPPLAITVTNAPDVIPCSPALPPLVMMDECEQHEFVGPGAQLLTAWICPY